MKTPDSLKKAKSSAASVVHCIKTILQFIAALPFEFVFLVVLVIAWEILK
jgi:hypothetical protein